MPMRPDHQMLRTMPVLDVASVGASVAFYRDVLGFATLGIWGEDFAILQRATVTVAFARAQYGKPVVSPYWAAYVYVRDADALYAEFKAHGLACDEGPEDRPYNCRDFTVEDPDGHLFGFGHTITPDKSGPGLGDDFGRDDTRTARAP